MKKILCLLLVVSVLFLTACSNSKSERALPTEMFTDEERTSFTRPPEVEEINKSTVIDDRNTFIGYPVDTKKSVIKGERRENTISGLAPLSEVSFIVPLKRSDIVLSSSPLSHSHGPASGGKPHHTVVDFQESFDRFGAFTLDTKAKEKVLYLTFDCGYEHDSLTSRVLDTLKEKQVPAAFFCTLDHIKKETEIIGRMINEGHIVGNHSATHPSFSKISREKMVQELEETENYLRKNYGYASRFFRFPAGEYTEEALDLVASLGYVSVFWSVAYNDWNVNVTNGKAYAVETVMSRLHNGAIILLHSVSHDNAEALGEIIDRARAEGYTFRALTELGE